MFLNKCSQSIANKHDESYFQPSSRCFLTRWVLAASCCVMALTKPCLCMSVLIFGAGSNFFSLETKGVEMLLTVLWRVFANIPCTKSFPRIEIISHQSCFYGMFLRSILFRANFFDVGVLA